MDTPFARYFAIFPNQLVEIRNTIRNGNLLPNQVILLSDELHSWRIGCISCQESTCVHHPELHHAVTHPCELFRLFVPTQALRQRVLAAHAAKPSNYFTMVINIAGTHGEREFLYCTLYL
jgi:hypothetical protein